MATPRRSARIAAQPTVTWYSADGYTKEDRVLPPYRGLTEEQCKQLDKDGTRIQNYTVKIQKTVLPTTSAIYAVDMFLYIKKHPLILLRAPTARASILRMLMNLYISVQQNPYDYSIAQWDIIVRLYNEFNAMVREFPQNPLYVA
jgi:hypothetical protein